MPRGVRPRDNGYTHHHQGISPKRRDHIPYSNGGRPPFRNESPSSEHVSKKPRTSMAIDNPKQFQARKSLPMSQHEASPNGVGEHQHTRCRESAPSRNDIVPEKLRTPGKRVPGLPSPEDMDIFASKNDAIRDKKPKRERSPDSPNVVCVDSAERSRERRQPTRRKPVEKAPNPCRPRTVKTGKETKPKISLRSVPLPRPTSSRLHSSVAARPQQNDAAQGSQRTQGDHFRSTRAPPLLKVPGLKSATRQNTRTESASCEPGRELEKQMVEPQSVKESEPVDLDAQGPSEPTKIRSESSVLQKMRKRNRNLSTARSVIENSVRDETPVINLEFLCLVDTELSKVAEIPVAKDGSFCNLSHNCLTKLSNAVCNWLVALRPVQLNLQGNELQILHVFPRLSRLRLLNLSRNKLRFIPDEITKLSNLCSLDVSKNEIDSIPSGFRELKRLEQFDISDNRLKTLPHDFAGQDSVLYSLDVSGNASFEEFPECAENLTKLVDLRLFGTLLYGSKLLRGRSKQRPAVLLKNIAGCNANKDMTSEGQDSTAEEIPSVTL